MASAMLNVKAMKLYQTYANMTIDKFTAQFHQQAMGPAVDTPVKNLYIGSCGATQIGGVPGAIAAAYQCVKQVK
jgi:hypothetical protein